VTPRPLKGASAEELSEACLDCHAGNPNQLRWLDHGGYGCASCHSVHAAPPTAPSLLAEGSVTATCLGCHADLRRSLTQRSRHPLAEGKMDCASCHDPHGTGTAEHMVRADSNTELCVGCHANKRGPHLWEHAPVRENCLNCHAPHGSNHEGLLVTQTARLCQQCHMQGRHQTVAGMPNEPWIFNRSCLNCHPMIHGSNHPSGVIFQR
jgi:DmsE family decaheme c-type cytochrome